MKAAGWLICGVLLFACLGLGYQLLDTRHAMSDAYSEVEHQRRRSDDALIVIRHELVGADANVLENLRGRFVRPYDVVKGNDDVVEINDLVFVVRDGMIADVHYLE
jgi:hypothetical protein